MPVSSLHQRAERSSARPLAPGGPALIAGGALLIVATFLHPSVETPRTIIANESRLVAAHVVFTIGWLLILLGLPTLNGGGPGRRRRLAVAGFRTAFMGTALIAVTGYFGLLAPVLAKQAPDTIDAIADYPPVAVINAVAAVTFIIGYVLLGIALSRNVALPPGPGLLIAAGAPTHLIGFGAAQFVAPALWPIAILGSIALGGGLGWAGQRLLAGDSRNLRNAS